jgi:hypothetical protein
MTLLLFSENPRSVERTFGQSNRQPKEAQAFFNATRRSQSARPVHHLRSFA